MKISSKIPIYNTSELRKYKLSITTKNQIDRAQVVYFDHRHDQASTDGKVDVEGIKGLGRPEDTMSHCGLLSHHISEAHENSND